MDFSFDWKTNVFAFIKTLDFEGQLSHVSVSSFKFRL